MLTPAYLEGLPQPVLALYEQAELDILRNMAERIARYDYWIPAADWQNLKLKEAGRMQEDILRILSQYTGKSEAELRALMQKATWEGLRADRAVYEAAGETVPSFTESAALVNTLNAGYRATRQTMRNLTRTTANTATQQFERALDRAWMQVKSGAMSYDQAVTNAVKGLARRGVESIRYPTGHTDTIEVAVRRAVVTGINQTTLRLQDELADEMDCDLVEVTAHAGARPSHAVWQGKIYSRSGKSKKYPHFSTATGYGTGAGLGGWNCRHSFYPYYEGSPRAYTDEQLEEYNAKTVTYNGEKMTEYEASQKQRSIERQIRWWKREYAAMEAAGQDTGPAAAKLKSWREKERDFLAQTGLKRQSAREQVAGFGRSQAARATAAGKKTVANASKSGIMKSGGGSVTIRSIDSPIEGRNSAMGKPSAILHYDVPLTSRQERLLESLPRFDSQVTVLKKDVSMTDLAALTAKTGHEFAMFTKGDERLIVRGNRTMVRINTDIAERLAGEGYRWSGHTHPGTDANCLVASEGDRIILRVFRQENSVIYNSKGDFRVFGKE